MVFDFYDRILAAIAACLILGVVLGIATPLDIELSVLLGSLAATVFVYLGVFLNPPAPTVRRQVTTAVVGWHLLILLYVVLFVL